LKNLHFSQWQAPVQASLVSFAFTPHPQSAEQLESAANVPPSVVVAGAVGAVVVVVVIVVAGALVAVGVSEIILKCHEQNECPTVFADIHCSDD